MQLSNTPGKLVLPFANAGGKITIPTASQIGITPGAASLTDGFPPLTRTPITAGGVPPSGLDMNGVLYEMSAIDRWAVAGGGYAFDSAFANDANVGGYPKGSRVMQSDGLGYWLNTAENNVTNPESSPVGWLPDTVAGIAAVTMTNANVTLTPLQYGKPTIVISGTLTANLNLIFPTISGEWTVINNTTGAFTITAKTASGTGYVVTGTSIVICDGTNIINLLTQFASSLAANGYQKLPSGLIVQWGGLSVVMGADVFQTLPIAFSSGVYSVVCTSAYTTGSGVINGYGVISPVGRTQLVIRSSNNTILTWIAIGK